MSLLSGKLNQTATYWEMGGVDSAGELEFSTPIQISVRWEDTQETYFDRNGEERRSRSVVYVGQDLSLEGYLLLGVSAASDPRVLTNAFQIEAFLKEPSLSAGEYVRRAML